MSASETFPCTPFEKEEFDRTGSAAPRERCVTVAVRASWTAMSHHRVSLSHQGTKEFPEVLWRHAPPNACVPRNVSRRVRTRRKLPARHPASPAPPWSGRCADDPSRVRFVNARSSWNTDESFSKVPTNGDGAKEGRTPVRLIGRGDKNWKARPEAFSHTKGGCRPSIL